MPQSAWISKSLSVTVLAALAGFASSQAMRPPAVPLVAHDPYFSVWSTGDRLTDENTRHWTGAEHSLTSLVRIDGKPFRIMGKDPSSVPALAQTALVVRPTRTVVSYSGQGVSLRLTFTTPTLPADVDVLSRPATYVTWQAQSADGKPHQVSVYFSASAQLAVNSPDQTVAWSKPSVAGLNVARIGMDAPMTLRRSGDNLRIEWGQLYLAAPLAGSRVGIASREDSVDAFVASGSVGADDRRMPRRVNDATPVCAAVIGLGTVGKKPVARHAILAYDDEYSIMFFNRRLRPYWRHNGADASALLRVAERDYDGLQRRCEEFDRELVADLTRAGGANYAYLGSLAFRQCFAAHKVVADAKGQPLMFSKENFSNGCIGTVDVLYPAAPALLLFSPTLTKASLVPILEYSLSSRWKFPFAPHDLGQYPLANGQVYGGGERTEDNQMPVEESGNMLILLAALAQQEGNANFTVKYWRPISQWADYLAKKGFDPESQLSTDDFAGHLAHNVNLSAKAIEALGAYAYLCDLRGLKSEGSKYRALALQFARRWVDEAKEGDHFRLAFDKPGTWSQKYNLVWDRLLGLNLFPASVARQEMDYYRRMQNRYGLPLDSRRDYTKLDWIVWTATLTGARSDFDALVSPVVDFLNATPDRVPMTDWFRTVQPRKEGFQARSVVGGVFIKLLDDRGTWRKYARRDPNKAAGWAALPPPLVITEVVPSSQNRAIDWAYATDRPDSTWFQPAFDASSWKRGPGGFGTRNTPSTVVRTNWSTPDIWLRREFDLPQRAGKNLQLWVHHDEGAEIYINGVLAARLSGYSTRYDLQPLSSAGLAALKPGRNVIAVHCHQTGGGQYIDVGLAEVKEPGR